jgi:hypothetical protein
MARRLFRRAPEVIRDESLPALAWICRVSRRSARMVVGPQVEVSSRGISEGAWVGPFRHESLGDSPCVFGSGVVFDDDGCVFVPPSHPREALYVLEDRREGVSHVSNSLCFALTRLPGGVFERFLTSLRPTLWDTVSRALARGVVEKGAVDLHSDAGYRLSRLSFLRFRLSGAGRPVVVPDGGPHHFPDFRTYRDYLSHSLGDLFANAADAERSHSLHPLVALSSGYDSTAVAVLAAENGCRTAATIDVAVYGKPDSGQATASRLGLDVVSRAHVMGASIEQLNGAVEPAVGALAVEFLATDGIGDDVIFLPFEPELRQGMLLTGHWGDTLWSRDARVGSAMPVASPFGRSLTEFRLRVGFANVPVPYIGGRSGDSIGRISRSGEMAAFSVGGDYDRPIPRRIGEEAGLDRSGFGTEKVATAPLFTDGAAHFVDAVAAVSRRYAWVAL